MDREAGLLMKSLGTALANYGIGIFALRDWDWLILIMSCHVA